MMFRKHWQLRESPFRGTLDWRRFFASPTHEEALARLHFLVDERKRLGLLLGPTGCGKSLVLEVFARRLRRGGAQVANLSLLGLDLREFLWLTAAELGINPDRLDDPFRLWRGVLDRLTENRYQQLDTVLLLDDANEATTAVLDHVVRLAQFDSTSTGRLTVLLAANDNGVGRLTLRLLELADLRIDLDPWEPVDTVQYAEASGSSIVHFHRRGAAPLTRFFRRRATPCESIGGSRLTGRRRPRSKRDRRRTHR